MSDDEEEVPGPSFFLTLEWRRAPPKHLEGTPLPRLPPLIEIDLSWFTSWRRNQPPQMNLGEENQFYWSKELGGYVETGKEEEYRMRLAKPAPPPPKAVVTTPTVPPVRQRGRKYVGVDGQRVMTPVPVLFQPVQIIPPRVEGVDKMRVLLEYSPCFPPTLTYFSLEMPIFLDTYDWDAALAEFEKSVQWDPIY